MHKKQPELWTQEVQEREGGLWSGAGGHWSQLHLLHNLVTERSCCCSVIKLCPTLCNSMNYSIAGFFVLHYLPVHPNSCPLSQWCHPTISPSVTPFSSWPQAFLASGSFLMRGVTLTLMCLAPPKPSGPSLEAVSTGASCKATLGLTEAIFLSKRHPVPSEVSAEETGHRVANTPAPCSTVFPNRRKVGGRETERKKERDLPPCRGNHCFQGYSDFQKLISVHPDKIPAARGTTLDRDHLLEWEGKIGSGVRGGTQMNTDRPQTARMWFARSFEWPEDLYYTVRGKILRRSNKGMGFFLEGKQRKGFRSDLGVSIVSRSSSAIEVTGPDSCDV